jgi:hypothetical protein
MLTRIEPTNCLVQAIRDIFLKILVINELEMIYELLTFTKLIFELWKQKVCSYYFLILQFKINLVLLFKLKFTCKLDYVYGSIHSTIISNDQLILMPFIPSSLHHSSSRFDQFFIIRIKTDYYHNLLFFISSPAVSFVPMKQGLHHLYKSYGLKKREKEYGVTSFSGASDTINLSFNFYFKNLILKFWI